MFSVILLLGKRKMSFKHLIASRVDIGTNLAGANSIGGNSLGCETSSYSS